MAYRLDPTAETRAELVRVIHEQSSKARSSLADAGAGPRALDAAVHDARKKLKKVRAALRLGRFAWGETVYQRENIAARDLARRLAATRDAAARIETLDRLGALYDDSLAAIPFPNVRGALDARLKSARATLRASGALDEAGGVLDAIGARIAEADFDGDGFASLAPGLARTWGRGRDRRADALGGGEVDDFHEWRKRAKYSRYHLRLLAGVWRDVMDPWVDGMHRLTDVLGEAHDMALLKATLDDIDGVDDRETSAAQALAESRQAACEVAAAPLGERLYAESSAALVKRLEGWWRAARADG